MKNFKTVSGFLSLSQFLILVFIAGCKAEPVKPSGFIKNPEMMKKYDLIPFQKAWKDPNFKASTYNQIMVVPVFTQNQLDKSWMEEANVRTWLDKEDKDVKEFARYTEKAFKADEFLQILDKRPLETGVKIEDKKPGIKLINP